MLYIAPWYVVWVNKTYTLCTWLGVVEDFWLVVVELVFQVGLYLLSEDGFGQSLLFLWTRYSQ